MGKQETKPNENKNGDPSSVHTQSNSGSSCDGLPADVLDYLVTRPDDSESQKEEEEETISSKLSGGSTNKSGSNQEKQLAALAVGIGIAATDTLSTTIISSATDRQRAAAALDAQLVVRQRQPGAFHCVPDGRNNGGVVLTNITRENDEEELFLNAATGTLDVPSPPTREEDEFPFLATAELVNEEEAGALEEVGRLRKELQELKHQQQMQQQERTPVVAAERLPETTSNHHSPMPFESYRQPQMCTNSSSANTPRRIRRLAFDSLQDHLFGRDAEVDQLKNAFQRLLTTSHQKQLVQIGGVSGSGKSTLALQLKTWMIDQLQQHEQGAGGGGGCFLSGKFDAVNGKPYSAIGTALDGFCEAFMSYKTHGTELPMEFSMAGSDAFLEKIDTCLDQDDMDLLSTVVPSLLGLRRANATTSKDNNSVDQAKHRFHHAVQRLIRIMVASSGGSLVLVLDDVQWADSASLDLMASLLLLANDDDDDDKKTNDGDDNYMGLPIMVVATYRDNEVDADHIYTKAIRDIKDQAATFNNTAAPTTTGIAFTDIHLGALVQTEVCDLLHQLLSSSSESNKKESHNHEALASLVHQKTAGNPFYVKQFLLSLEHDGLLWYSSSHQEWQYQLEELRQAAKATDNVVELLTEKLQSMPPLIQSILPRLALLGSSFPAISIQIIVRSLCNKTSGITEGELVSTIVNEGILVEFGRGGWYKWEHDKVQDAALSLVRDQHELTVMKSNVGRLLLEQLSSEELSSHLFVVTDLLNTPASLGETTSTVCNYQLVDLNLRAGKKALQASAFDSAAKYLHQGILLLPDDKWKDHLFGVSLDLYSTAAEAHYCVGEFDQSKIYCDEVNSLAGCPFVKKRRVNNVMVNSLYSQGKVQEALVMVVRLLSMLGCKFPRFGKGLVGTSGLIRLSMNVGETMEKLATIPPMEDEAKKWSIYLLDRCANISYLYEPELMPLCLLKGLRRTVKYGRTEYAAPMLATIALIVCGAMGDFAGGKKFADLAIQFMDSSVESRTLFLCNHFVLHYQIPVHRCIESLLLGYASGIRCGDLESAFWSKLTAIEARLHAGYALPKLFEDCASFSRSTSRHKQEMIGWSVQPLWQLALNLIDTDSPKEALSGEIMNETEFRKQIEEHTHFQRLLNRVKATASFWFDKHELVVQLMDEYAWHTFGIEKETPGANGIGTLYFHCAMSCVALAHRDGATHRTRKQQAKKFLKKLKGWANKGNPNVQHYESLLEAELASCNGKPFVVAAKHYECAILISGRMNFMNDFGLAHEKFGDHCSRNGDVAGAKDHYQRALESYHAWGAAARVELLRKRCSL